MTVLITKQIKDALIALIKTEVSEFDSNVIGYHKTPGQVNEFPICMIYYVRDDKDVDTVGEPEMGRVQGIINSEVTIYTEGDDAETEIADLQKKVQDAIENDDRLGALNPLIERTVVAGSETVVYMDQDTDVINGIVEIALRTTYDHELGNS